MLSLPRLHQARLAGWDSRLQDSRRSCDLSLRQTLQLPGSELGLPWRAAQRWSWNPSGDCVTRCLAACPGRRAQLRAAVPSFSPPPLALHCHSWDDIGGLEDVKKKLRRVDL